MDIVIDADVLIGALDGSDPHHPEARSLFAGWQTSGASVAISVVNLSEVLVAPAADTRVLGRARRAIAALGVTVHQPGEALAVDAARMRQVYPLSLPDAYCLATARQTRASLASFDLKVVRAAQAERIAMAVTATGRARSSPRRTR